ncbi:FMN-binding protein [Streptomyces sp. NPDC006332]|uniref:FMN-binding protein n=1 Tax=Streptomyces sp. NPDC006332 TaxID=3155456 RepID=UPI0033B1BDA3
MHPLKRNSSLRRIVLACVATVSGVVLVLSLKPHSSPGITVAAPAPSGGGHTAPGPVGPSASRGSGGDSGTASPRKSPGGGSTSTVTKTVTGDPAETIFGPVQVRISLKDGKITKAEAVTYPKANALEEQLNEFAVPQLNQEALKAQSANIDVVTGATYTSQGYAQSLQSALDSTKG